ncbi:hypothetical protein ACTVZO_42845 [Streptomyces sp. IBSNAI002]
MIRRFRRCGSPGALTPEDQATVDQSRAKTTGLRHPAALAAIACIPQP